MPRNSFSVGRNPANVSSAAQPASRRPKPLLWAVILIAMAVWTLLAWLAYASTDPILAWLTATVSGVVENGQGVAEVLGGRPAGEAVRALDASGLAGQLLELVRIVAKPAIIALWGLGIAVLAALPVLASVVRRVVGRLR